MEKRKRKKARGRRPRISRLRRKLLVASALAVLLLLALLVNLYYVSIVKGPEYAKMAQRQWQSSLSLKAERGRILDRNGNVLAESYTTYQVCVNPQAITEDADRERIANILSTLLNVNYESIIAKMTKINPKDGKPYQQVKIKDQVESNVIAQLVTFQENRAISYYSDVKRNYPEGNLFGQLLGFTNVDGDGQTGVELSYNTVLSGVDGKQIAETDRDGNEIPGGESSYIAPIGGAAIQLTVDTGIEGFLQNALEEAARTNLAKYAYGVVMSPKTGEIYAISSYPTIDPNNPPRTDAETLLDLSRQRMVTETYEPGSVFKVVTLAAALDSGTVNDGTTFKCKGYLNVLGQKIKCWRSKGHGSETLAQAVQNSCNPAFMSMAIKMGTDKFYEYIYAFGMNDKTGVGIGGETTGKVTHKKYIRDTDLARIGFGQSISCTGMQMAMAVCAAINGGELLKPYYVQDVTATSGEVLEHHEKEVVRQVITPETSALIRKYLTGVVDSGSGRNAAIPGYSVGGKTGTSQKYDENGKVSSTLLVASFVGFVPADDPEYLCMIIVDEPQVPVVYGSTVAAPYVQQVLKNVLTYFSVPTDRKESAVSVPDVRGMTVEQATAALKSAGLDAVYMESEKAAAVQRQSPSPGNFVVRGSPVILYTAWTTFQGEEEEIEMTKVPKLEGKNRINALDALTKAGLVMDYDRSNSAGTVTMAQYPEGTEVPKGTTVHVEFSGAKTQE
ncbi:MAG: PASTA domain-containing protein [Clostridia bacterium]|nr:PASTA domain-containing protein [Clostridia bacterium]